MQVKKKYIIITLVAAIFLVIGCTAARAYMINNTVKPYENLIFPGVSIEDVDISGKTKDEAVNLVQEKYGNEVLKKKININGGNRTYTIDYSKLNAKYNIEEAVNEALEYGKSHNLFQKYRLIKKPVEKSISLKFTYDDTAIKELISVIAKEIDKAPVNASIKMVNKGQFSITPEVAGAKLNVEKLEKDIENNINGSLTGDSEVNAEIDSVQASVTKDMLSHVNTKISSFTTSFASSSANRVTNISLATKAINGKLLMPGESFSFNEVVGERTTARGYKEAGVIINNQLDSGIGGGICQVSTTLYNAVMRANINYTERRHHSLASSYVAPGLDATVSYGSIDYKFKNTLDYPIYIEGYISGKSVTFSIYSDSTLAKKTYNLISEVYDTIKPEIKYIDDPNKYEGETEVVTKPSTGYKVRVYRTTYENGKLINKEKLYEETYKKVDGVTKKGTKKRPSAPAAETPTAATKSPAQEAETPDSTTEALTQAQ